MRTQSKLSPAAMTKVNGAYATLITKASYLPGTLVLAHTLQQVGSKYPLLIMVSPDLPRECLDVFKLRALRVVSVERLTAESQDPGTDDRMAQTWSKLAVFNLTDYERIVLLDSDMIVRRNMDELIEMQLEGGWIAATHVCACNPRKLSHYPKDWTPENCAYSSARYPPEIKAGSPRPYRLLNSGTVVLNPSNETFNQLLHFLKTSPLIKTYIFPDQDLLADFFKGKWRPLPYVYNALKTLPLVHPTVWKDDETKCVHYILADKPWTYKLDDNTNPKYYTVDKWWWDAFRDLERGFAKIGSDDSRRGWSYVRSLSAS